MKVLYISTVFPRPEQSSTIYTDLAEELKRRGHEITVIAADGNQNTLRAYVEEERGIQVLRVKTGKIYNVGVFQKGISVITLKFYIIKAIKKFLATKKFDFILFETPPINIIDVVKWSMNYFKCPSYLMIKDIFPQNGVDIGIIKENSIIYKYFRQKEKKLYYVANHIGCMSEGNRDYIITHNLWLDKNKVEIFPNTKKAKPKISKPKKFMMRKKYGIPENAVVAIYGGNMGKPQGLDFFMDIIDSNRTHESIFFLLIGRGTERKKILEFLAKNSIKNVLLLNTLPRQDYEEILPECDIGLVFLNKNFTIPNFPSRVLSYFEYGLPVIAATDKMTDFKNMIEDASAGYWIESGNIDEFNSRLNELARNKQKRCNMGKLGRIYLEEHFKIDISISILEKHFQKDNDKKIVITKGVDVNV